MYDRIKTLCKLKKMSITSLCEEMTGNSGNLATWKKNNFKTETASRLAQYFNVSLDYLISGKESANVISNVGDSNFNVANSSNNNFFEKRQQLGEIEEELFNICSKLNTMKKAELLFLARDLMNNGKL